MRSVCTTAALSPFPNHSADCVSVKSGKPKSPENLYNHSLIHQVSYYRAVKANPLSVTTRPGKAFAKSRAEPQLVPRQQQKHQDALGYVSGSCVLGIPGWIVPGLCVESCV